jgi:hypothetical protein
LGADYEVIVIDPRDEFASGFGVPDVTFSGGMPDDVILDISTAREKQRTWTSSEKRSIS